VTRDLAEFRETRRTFRDPDTGREIWQMTGGGGDSVAPYMYCQAMTADERYLCFESDRTGTWQPYRLEVETGAVRQLASCEDYARFSFNMRPQSGELLFRAGKRVCAVDVLTGESRVTADLDDLGNVDHVAGICVADAKGERVALPYWDRDERAGIALLSLDGSLLETVFRRDEGVQHVLINPMQPDLVSFAVSPDYQNEPDGPPERRARAWLLDARTGEARPNLVMPPGFRATHEYWSADGERLYFHKKTVGPGPGTQWIPTWINSIAREGGDERVHFESDSLYLGHSCVNRAETRIVSDEQRQGGVNVLIDIDAKARTAETICWPNLLLDNAIHCHVHPSLSPSERFVVYTSNVTGRAEVYLAPLTDRDTMD